MIDTATAAGREARATEIMNEHIAKSRYKGDYHFRLAELWGADGDYIPGLDDGETPRVPTD
jgi:hypothetical protein